MADFEDKMNERCEACILKYQCANLRDLPPCALEPEPWNKISDYPKEGVPLLLSDGDSIYSGFYGKLGLKRKYHAWGTNAEMKYWKYAPKLPPKEVEKSG